MPRHLQTGKPLVVEMQLCNDRAKNSLAFTNSRFCDESDRIRELVRPVGWKFEPKSDILAFSLFFEQSTLIVKLTE